MGRPVALLFIDYGQPARRREWQAAQTLSAILGLTVSRICVEGLTIPSGLIPGRNALLLNLALMHQRLDSSSVVAIGIHAGTNYADCSTEFVRSMQMIYDLYTSGVVQIDAPFVNWQKNHIWHLLVEHKYPVEHTYSCEAGDQPCGRCLSCLDLEMLRAR